MAKYKIVALPKRAEYMELDLTPEEIQEYAKGGYIIEDISVPSLNEFPNGGEPKRKKTKFQPGTYDPNETAGYMLDEQEVVVPAQASAWGKARNEYKRKHPEEEFIEKKKRQYVRQSNKGLNKLFGVSTENFNPDVEQNFRDEYDYNTNTAVVKKVAKQQGWNPNKRSEYVDKLNPTQRSIVANSKYGSKLQPGYWNRSLAGLQELGNTILPGQPFQYNIPGLTKKEQKEMRDSKLSAFELLAPLDIPGVAIANYTKNRGLTTGSDYKQLPGLLSGEKMENVSDMEAMAFNPLTYAGIEALPELVLNAPKNIKNLSKFIGSEYKNIAEGANPFNYAWKSPAARYDNLVGYAEHADDMPMSKELFESLKSNSNLSSEDKILLKRYEKDSRPFTGRGNTPIDQKARTQLDDLINRSNITSDQPIVLSRRIDASNPELFDLKNKIYEPERPTSWSAGRDNIGNESYGSASDRMVIKLPKNKEHTMLKNPYLALTDEELAQYATELKNSGLPDDVINYQLDFMKGNRSSERELLLPSDAKFRRIGKVKNDIGGYDYIMKPKGTSNFSIFPQKPIELPGYDLGKGQAYRSIYESPKEGLNNIPEESFKPWSPEWEALQEAKSYVAGPQRTVKKSDYFTDAEFQDMLMQEMTYNLARDEKELQEMLTGKKYSEDLFKEMNPGVEQPNFRTKMLTPEQESIVKDMLENNPSVQSNPLYKKNLEKMLADTEITHDAIPGNAAIQDLNALSGEDVITYFGNQYAGVSAKDLPNLSPEEIEKTKELIIKRMGDFYKKYDSSGKPYRHQNINLNAFGGTVNKTKLSKFIG